MYITPVNNYLKMAVRIQESSIHVPNFFPQILLKEEQAVRKLGIWIFDFMANKNHFKIFVIINKYLRNLKK